MIRIFKHLPFLAIISVSFAETIPNLNEIEKSQPVDNSPQVYHPRHRWEISYIARKWDYSETTANKTLMAESGLLQGVRASYYRPLGHSLFFIKPAVSYIGGKTEYKGATWEGEGLHSEDRHVIADADLQVGAHKRLGNNVFGSLGVSAYFRRLIHPRTKSKGSYRREVDYKTVGFHLSSTYHRNNLFITPIIRYDHLLEGKARAFLGKANSDYPNLKLEQKKGKGLLFALESALVLKNQTLRLRPYYRTWEIRESEKSAIYEILNKDLNQIESMYWVEPENKTTSFGIDLSLSF